MCRPLSLSRFLALLCLAPLVATAAPFAEGPKKCQECHEAEYGVWEATRHAKSFKKIHKTDKAKAIVTALGDKSMKKSETCQLCHYTMIKKSAGATAKAKVGISCESCHGASSEWREVHNDYGGSGINANDESAAHKAERQQSARDAGMIWSFMHYDIASNCNTCHGLAHPDLDGAVLATMLEAGHPINPDFELVAYSQGEVRHRFYPPDITVNAKMTGAELARFFVTGQATKLVSASAAAAKSDNADYKAAQQTRIDGASNALSGVSSVPEAAALVADPSEANARKLIAAIEGKDLSAEVGSMLPAESSYK